MPSCMSGSDRQIGTLRHVRDLARDPVVPLPPTHVPGHLRAEVVNPSARTRPDTNDIVEAARHDMATVRAERHACDAAFVPQRRRNRLPCFGIPDAQRAVDEAAGD